MPFGRRPERRSGSRRLRAPSHVRLIQWPGQSDKGAPDDFPGGGQGSGEPAGSTGHAAGADEAPRIVIRTNPVFRRAPDAAGEAGKPGKSRSRIGALRADVGGAGSDASTDGDADAGPGEEPEERRRRREAVWRAAAATPRGFNHLVAAVYAALADPLMGGSDETRARRAARIRRAGTVAASAAVGFVLIYAIFPVRTYLDQRSATQRTHEELDVLTEANERLADRAEQLRDDEVVEEIARRDYGLVLPGEEPYAVLPPPVGTTSTTPTTTP